MRGQVDDLLNEIRLRERKGERVLVTTLTKRMAEDLTDYLQQMGVRVRYMHSDIDAIERMEIVRGLRLGEFDVLVGINLLREGLDLPEVSLVAILDADQEGFLRSDRSLIQTVGRAARHVNGRAIFYADRITGSMQRCIDETNAPPRRSSARTTSSTASRHDRGEEHRAGALHHARRRRAQASARTRAGRSPSRWRRTRANGHRHARGAARGADAEAAANLDFESAAALRDQLFEVKAQGSGSAAALGSGSRRGQGLSRIRAPR